MPMALAVIVVVTFATLAVFYTFVNVHSQRLASNKSALEKLQASFEETGKFQKLYDELRDKIAMLNGMQTRRVTWYKRWRALSERRSLRVCFRAWRLHRCTPRATRRCSALN